MALGRYGLSIDDVQQVIGMALGSEVLTSTVEGRERYGVAVRYPRASRSDPQSIAREIHVSLPAGGSVPLGEVAEVKLTRGATGIRTENGQLSVYVFVDIADRDLGGYVAEAKEAVAGSVRMPAGYSLAWSGQYEYLERAKARLAIVVPLTLALIFLLLYLNFKALTETLIVMLSLPFALVGGIWLMWWMEFNSSVAVAVGFIALAGVAAETGVIMLIYLDQALRERRAACAAEGRFLTHSDLQEPIMVGAVERVRPKMMTVVAIMAGLVPPLEHRVGVGGHAADRRPDDRRNGILDDPHIGGHSGRLRLGEGLAAVLVERTEESQSIQCRTTNVQRRATMRRREFLFSAAAAASAWTIGPAFAAGREMVVYKDPNCGCCHAWAEAMKGAGFTVGIKDVDDLSAVKQRYAIPDEMQGCHTAVVGGYYVEGHVPLDAVERLLAERPDIAGIAVPGMPVGSLGMGDDPRASYDVYAVKRDGTSAIYQSVRPKG